MPSPDRSTPIASIFAEPCRFEGTYRIRGMRERRSRRGEHFVCCELADASGAIRAYAWPERVGELALLPDWSVVRVEARSRQFGGVTLCDLIALETSGATPLTGILRLLPAPLCPVPGLLGPLSRIVEGIDSHALRDFVLRVLAEDRIALPLLSAPASIRYHHGHPGGLLEHSLEVAEIVQLLPLAEAQRDIAIVGALLHDLGKIWTLDHRLRRTSMGNLVAHEHLVLEICAPALASLDGDWPDAGLALRHLWSCLAGRYRQEPAFPAVFAVQLADRLSAERDKEVRAFGRGPAGALHARLGEDRFWRPQDEPDETVILQPE